MLGYRAQSNFIHIGPVEIGSNAFVGEASVIDIDTVMGDDTQLGHASSLQSGQRVPDGKRYHGSPAVETTSDYCPIESRDVRRASAARSTRRSNSRPCSWSRCRCRSSAIICGISIRPPPARAWPPAPPRCRCSASRRRWFFGAHGVRARRDLRDPAPVHAVPEARRDLSDLRLPLPAAEHHPARQQLAVLLRAVRRHLRSSCSYMRYVGWNLNKVEQTGSNMGTNQRHDNPFLCNIGSGTMVSDGLSMINMHMSATSFRLAESKIGENNYLGNDIFYPPNGRTGANVLLGTKTMIPIDGPVRENVGLLGSPAFEIPRMVDRDRDMNASIDETTRRTRLRQKNALQRRHRGALPAEPLDVGVRRARPVVRGARELRPLRRVRAVRRDRRDHGRLHRLLRAARTREPRASSGSSRSSPRSTIRTSGSTSGTGSSPSRRSPGCSRARRSASCCSARWA